MTTEQKRDVLLITARVGTIAARALLACAMVAVAIGIVTMAIAGMGYLPEAVQVEFDPALDGRTAWLLVGTMIGVLVALALSYDFTARLARIIDTVGEGD